METHEFRKKQFRKLKDLITQAIGMTRTNEEPSLPAITDTHEAITVARLPDESVKRRDDGIDPLSA